MCETFSGWFVKFCATANGFNLPYNKRDRDYYYDYYVAGMTPRDAVLEEIKEYYYDEEEDWN
jgi:hypothetical protein